MRMFGILDDMELKLKNQFAPTMCRVHDANGDLYKVDVKISERV